VRLSAFTVVDAYPEDPGAADRLLDVVALARSAEAAGLSTLWVAEHHFQTGGVCPAPPVLLAACGAATRRIRLGALVSVLPFHSPVEVAEQYAMLDRLTGGRLNLGVGSGYIPLELEGFGVDPATKRERFDQALATVLAGLEGREIVGDSAGARPVRLNVRPVQDPHPPIWVAVQRPEAVAPVARRGFSIALIPYATVPNVPALAEQIGVYRANRPAGGRGEVAIGLHVYAGDRVADARKAFRRYLESRLQTQSTFYQRKAAADPASATPEGIERSGFAVFGPAADVARRLHDLARVGVDEILGIFDFGGLPRAEVERSVAALGAAWADAAVRDGP